MDNIKKVLEPNHTTKVLQILYDVYQHVYSTLYVLAKAIDAPCPSPGLLSVSAPSQSKISEEELKPVSSQQEEDIKEQSEELETPLQSPEQQQAKIEGTKVEEKVETIKES